MVVFQNSWDAVFPNVNAFNAGWKDFFTNKFERNKFYGDAYKEYERGFNSAYFRNIKYRAERNKR